MIPWSYHLEEIEQMERQRSQAIESLQIYDGSVKDIDYD